ncbi:MAG: tetratricopeptide repeat protein [Rhodospirillaceae bacterium]|nr:tetratricopeptide repeat protein [Rhodospirillaceae bacterium]
MNRKQRRATAASSTQYPPGFVEIFNTALQLQQTGQLIEAEAMYRRAMAMHSKVALLYSNLGVVVYSLGRVAESVPLYKKAIALDPTLSLALNNLGVSLSGLNRLDEALSMFARAMAIVPDDPEPLNNYGDCLVKLSRFAEGAKALERAIEMKPNYVEAMTNLGTSYWGQGRLDDAVAQFRRALALQPDVAMTHKNLGIVQLLRGEFAEGWREYDWRWVADKIVPRDYAFPEWHGEALGNKKLLVWAEQGVGDEILHASMMDDLVARGNKVVWEVDPRLKTLLQRSFPDVSVEAREAPPFKAPPGHDIGGHVAGGSIGRYVRYDVSQFPRDRQSYLKADPDRVAAYRAQINAAPGEKIIGLSWLSKNAAFGKSKSTTLMQWEKVLRTPGARFVNLQYGDTVSELKQVERKLGVKIVTIDGLDLKDDLDGFAALTAACDLITTVSNSTAHFAGALGIPVWILIAAGVGKFWYWGHNTEKVLWYPSATLIRQEKIDEWTPTIDILAERVAHFAAS